jgi:hypothetical protein
MEWLRKGTLDDRLGGVQRFIKVLADDPTEWEPGHLLALARIDGLIDYVRSEAVKGMRESGITDKQIGEALGITQQAVSKRWPGRGRYVGVAGRYRTNTLTT